MTEMPYEAGSAQADVDTMRDVYMSRAQREAYNRMVKRASLDQLQRAYALGWHASARWAGRLDLHSDVDSPAYERERDAALKDIA